MKMAMGGFNTGLGNEELGRQGDRALSGYDSPTDSGRSAIEAKTTRAEVAQQCMCEFLI